MTGISIELSRSGIEQENLDEIRNAAEAAAADLAEKKEAFNGWVRWPYSMPDKLLDKIEQEARRLRSLCEVLVVVGIGGSYLGTEAVFSALGGRRAGYPDLVFAGNSLSGEYHSRLLRSLEGRNFCICVVSKSGTTMESRLAFDVLKKALYDRYGQSAAERIVAVTDPVNGILRQEAEVMGYSSFEIPPDIGGRYSAFTPAILLPLAVSGADVRAFVRGAAEMAKSDFVQGAGLEYAMTRFLLMNSGKSIEAFEYFEPSLHGVGEWIKQLFAESEGKDGKGLFPVTMTFSTDLHSIGQFLQEGSSVFFETVIRIREAGEDVVIPDGKLKGRSLNEINALAVDGVINAHMKAGTPIIEISIPRVDESSLGALMYFLMMTTAVTGRLMKVDPFTQNGVEEYKAQIRALLGQE
ncbi:MAG: glucose-6-phosphate isomerase [Anaerovoracaceae bacterium]